MPPLLEPPPPVSPVPSPAAPGPEPPLSPPPGPLPPGPVPPCGSTTPSPTHAPLSHMPVLRQGVPFGLLLKLQDPSEGSQSLASRHSLSVTHTTGSPTHSPSSQTVSVMQ